MAETKNKSVVYDHRWSAAPSEFDKWWNPYSFNPAVGSIGGHPEARRAYIHSETGEARWYGFSAQTAWNTLLYRSQWQASLNAR